MGDCQTLVKSNMHILKLRNSEVTSQYSLTTLSPGYSNSNMCLIREKYEHFNNRLFKIFLLLSLIA